MNKALRFNGQSQVVSMAGFLVGSGCVSKVVVSGRGSAAVAVKYCAVYEKMRVKVQVVARSE
jgi:hypothetical protein